MDSSHGVKRKFCDTIQASCAGAFLEYTTGLWNGGAPRGDTTVTNTDPTTGVVVRHTAHGFLLRASSVFFRVALGAETSTGRTEIDRGTAAWLAALAFVYTQALDFGDDETSARTAVECFELADYLEAEGLRAACVAWMRETVDASTCCALFASGVGLSASGVRLAQDIVEIATECIGTCLSYEPEASSFWSTLTCLRAEHIEALLRSPTLSVVSEAALFDAVVRWADVAACDAGCIQRIVRLLDVVHLPLEVLADAVLDTPRSLAGSTGVFATALARCVKGETGTSTPRAINLRGVAFAHQSAPDARLELFVGSPEAKLYAAPGAPTLRERCAYVICGSRLYALGGEVEGARGAPIVVPTVDVLDLASGVSTQGPNMRRAMSGFSCAADASRIFVCGGLDTDGRASQFIDVMCTARARWSLCVSMHVRRASCASVVVDGSLYVLGGIAYSGAVLSSVEVLGIASQAPTLVTTAMPVERHSHVAVGVGRHIYVLGGTSDDDAPSDAAMVYDTTSRAWETLPPMAVPRSGFSAAAFGGYIYVCGGTARTRNCERYCIQSRTWTEISVVCPSQRVPIRPAVVLAI
jgi:hypothetical protein